jgi:hypothetical protein
MSRARGAVSVKDDSGRVDQLSSGDVIQLVNEMSEAATQSGDAELLRATADLGQGALASDRQQFATGMRLLSRLCNVPYD